MMPVVDPVDLGFAVVLLALGTLLVGLGVWALLRPKQLTGTRWAAGHQTRVAAGLLLIGVGILVRTPLSALTGPRVLADLISALALAFTLAGAALEVWAGISAREARRQA